MNLVQIQERLKDVPTQAIMQYANGGNPMVPPYLALAELKRRETVNQSAQAQQAMQQGRQPSVKDQIEQAAGLAALQKQMQQQGMQGLLAQARPQGIPENIPQPERQPESEGIAGLPAGDFNFADGGIVAFAAGGDEGLVYRAGLQERERAGMEEALQAEDPIFARLEMQRRRAMAGGNVNEARRIQDQIDALRSGSARVVKPETPQVPVATMGIETAQPQAVEQPPGIPPAHRREGALPPPGGIAGQIALPSRGAGAMPSGAPEGATGVAPEIKPLGIAAIQGADEAQKMILNAMRKQSTPESAYEAEQKMAGLYGLTQPYGEERVKRAKEMEATRQQDLESRGMERLMRVMGGIAGRGLQGAAPAYLSAIEGERASDLAFRKQMDELLGAVEEKRRAEQVAGMQRATTQMGEERKLSVGAAEEIYKAQRRREDEMAKIRLEHQLRMMQPNEATILMRVIDDLRRRHPEKSEAEIYAMAQESKAGVTPELKRQHEYAQQYEAAVRMIAANPTIVPKGMTNEQWIEEYISKALPHLAPKGAATAGAIPQQAIDRLKQNPQLRGQFDEWYGAGASAKYLGK